MVWAGFRGPLLKFCPKNPFTFSENGQKTCSPFFLFLSFIFTPAMVPLLHLGKAYISLLSSTWGQIKLHLEIFTEC